MYIGKSHVFAQLKYLVTTVLIRGTHLTIFCHNGMITSVVFISHLCQKLFEWEQWVLHPWTLLHGPKDKREAWKEETRSVQSQTQQEQGRAIDSHVSPSLAAYIQERLVMLQEGENGGTLLALQYTNNSLCCDPAREKKEHAQRSQTSRLFVFCPIRAEGSGRSQRSKGRSLRWYQNFHPQSFPHAVLTVQLLLFATFWAWWWLFLSV